MPHYKFEALLQNSGWLSPAYVSTDSKGIITSVDNRPIPHCNYESVNGFAVPGFQNAHSHAFQYAMAGVAEKHKSGANADDFWSWREAMYQIALTLNPDELERVATMLYAEMLRHGYTHVAEFHYLHHDKDGNPYGNIAEMGERLMVAAQKAGIKITLVPMFYQKGGFGMEPQPRQRRFISSTIDDYNKLLAQSIQVAKIYESANCGFGIHSLRAVSPEDIVESLSHRSQTLPVHIHIAEQLKEIEDGVAYLKARPVEWLLDNNDVNESFHLVHATHLTDDEIVGIAKSKAHVVLCPTTEGNLGDGLFPLNKFQQLDGKWSIGTDSHVGLNPLEELRLLDYGQRLTTHSRSIFQKPEETDSGKYCFDQSLIAGRKAMGKMNEHYFAIGEALDAVVYNQDFPLFGSSSLNNLLSTIIYCGDASSTLGTMVNGKWVVKNGQHENAVHFANDFTQVIKRLNIR